MVGIVWGDGVEDVSAVGGAGLLAGTEEAQFVRLGGASMDRLGYYTNYAWYGHDPHF